MVQNYIYIIIFLGISKHPEDKPKLIGTEIFHSIRQTKMGFKIELINGFDFRGGKCPHFKFYLKNPMTSDG